MSLTKQGEESKKEEGVGSRKQGILWLKTAEGDFGALVRPSQGSAEPQLRKQSLFQGN